MCNCGNKRSELSDSTPKKLSNPVNVNTNQPGRWPDVSFSYTGNSALTVTGGVTGKRYRFAFPGDIKQIDYRDASGMQSINLLKKVS